MPTDLSRTATGLAPVPRRARATALLAAVMLLVSGLAGGVASASTGSSCPDGSVPEDGFVDVTVDNVHEYSIDCLAWWAITAGTGEDTYSPESPVTREQMASFLVRTYEKVTGERISPTRDHFVDDNGSIHENDVNKLAEVGITAGCNPTEGNTHYCPHDLVTRAQMGSFLVRTYQEITGRTVSSSDDRFVDDDGNVHEANINRLAKLGITAGCNPAEGNTRYCPLDPVTRAQMATFLVRELGAFVELGEVEPPPPSPDGQTGNDGDPCEVSDCPEVTITSAVGHDNDGDGHLSAGDVWVIEFSVPMDTSYDITGTYEAWDEQYHYISSFGCSGGAYTCSWDDETTLRIRDNQEPFGDMYPATLTEFDAQSADGTPLDLEGSTDRTIDTT